MTHDGFTTEDGVSVSKHTCDTCGTQFTIAPPIAANETGWDHCLQKECESYDPDRDADVLFMDDAEYAQQDVVSVRQHKAREKYKKTGRLDD